VPDGKKLEYVVVYANSTDIIKLKPESVSLKKTETTAEDAATPTDTINPATDTDSQ
jgi:hypothetical protein